MTARTWVLADLRRISGGDWQAVVSLKAGTRIHVQIPAAVYGAGTMAETIDHAVEAVQRGIRPTS